MIRPPPHERPTPEELSIGDQQNRGITCKCGCTVLPVVRTARIGLEMVRIRKCRVCEREYQCRERLVGEVAKRKRD